MHKGAAQFQGINTSVAVGKYGMARYGMNYAQKPTEDLSYQLLVESTYYKGAKRYMEEWGGYGFRAIDAHAWANPLPDYQVFANMNYKDLTIAYRRLEERITREYTNNKDSNRVKGIENFADDINIIVKKPEYWKNTDWTTTIRFNNFYQMYDVFHLTATDAADSYEMKTEKRWELDSNVLMNPTELLSVVLGAQIGVWSAQGSGASASWNPVTRVWDPSTYSGAEFLPTFTEMGNDIAAVEAYIDAKYQLIDNLSITGGGRYVSEFNPGHQFRDEREKMHKFFPKAAVVFSPLENLFLKGIYQQGFTRLNTFERYSEQNNINLRGAQKATTAESTEFVVDARPVKNMKVLVSYYQEILYDFANFVYVGPGWPTVRPGTSDLRGFFNVGDHQVHGVEANISYDWNKFGGFISGSQLLKNRIANAPATMTGQDNGNGVLSDADSNFNKAAVPRWNMSVGSYFDISEMLSVSGIYKIHAKMQNRGTVSPDDIPGTTPGAHDWWDSATIQGFEWATGGELDLSATVRNIGMKNLNLTVLGKNINNAVYYSGSSMDRVHVQQVNPQYFEAKVSYLW